MWRLLILMAFAFGYATFVLVVCLFKRKSFSVLPEHFPLIITNLYIRTVSYIGLF